MERLSSLLKVPSNRNSIPNSERTEPIGYFTDEVNRERDGKKWKKVTPRYIAVKLAHIKACRICIM